MFPNPSSLIPNWSPSHLGGPGSGRRPVLTHGILSELINYSWNLHPGMSENFFFDYCAKISWKVTHIPNFMKIRPVVGEIRTWPYLAQLINLIFVNFFVFHYFQKGATWEGTTRGIKVSHQYLQIKPKRKKFWRPPSCHYPMIFLVLKGHSIWYKNWCMNLYKRAPWSQKYFHDWHRF